jgi:hypothetical protein
MELLSIGNMHATEPPAWLKEAPQGSRSYFENAFGEQWVAEAGDEELKITGGDVAWRTFSIARPDYLRIVDTLSRPTLGLPFGQNELMLNPPERAWLRAVCLSRV